MKKFLLILALSITPLVATSCQNPPSERVMAAQTLGTLGSTAKAGMDAATQLLKAGKITVPQWQNVATFYDQRWQPAYNLALAAVQSNLSSIASPDLQRLANEFAALIGQFSNTR